MLQASFAKGAQIQGLLLDDDIEAKLMGGLNDRQKADLGVQLLIGRLLSAVQTVDGSTVQEALQYLDDHVTIQT